MEELGSAGMVVEVVLAGGSVDGLSSNWAAVGRAGNCDKVEFFNIGWTQILTNKSFLNEDWSLFRSDHKNFQATSISNDLHFCQIWLQKA